jgi:hypothetical protein
VLRSLIDAADNRLLFHPGHWPLGLRRAALTGLPVSLPIWAFLVLLFIGLAILQDAWQTVRPYSIARRRRSQDHYSSLATTAGTPEPEEPASQRRTLPHWATMNPEFAVRVQARIFMGLVPYDQVRD